MLSLTPKSRRKDKQPVCRRFDLQFLNVKFFEFKASVVSFLHLPILILSASTFKEKAHGREVFDISCFVVSPAVFYLYLDKPVWI